MTQNISEFRNKTERHKYGTSKSSTLSLCRRGPMTLTALSAHYQMKTEFLTNTTTVQRISSVKSVVSASTVFVLLTFVVGHVPQRRVTRVSLALTLVEASFNPAL